MIEFPWNDRWAYESWFYFDEGVFSTEPDKGQLKLRTYKSTGRDIEGRLILHHQMYNDQNDWRDFSARSYEIDQDEYAFLLDRAIRQGRVNKEDSERYLALASAYEIRNWNIHYNMIVYMDDRFALFQERERVCFVSEGKCYRLTCHPYEPCIYIHLNKDVYVSIHNAFDPYKVVESFALGKRVTSISGKIYDGRRFCEMLDHTIRHYSDVDISYIEGALAVNRMKELGAIDKENAIEISKLGVRKISENFSHSRKLNERVMYTEDGKVYLRIRDIDK